MSDAPSPNRFYLVCATPRSGSTLLCEALRATGVAGRPEEYFEAMHDTRRPRHPEGYFKRKAPPEGLTLGHDQQPEGGEAGRVLRASASYASYLDWVLEQGTTPNGVFGAKLMWGYMDEVALHLHDLPGLAGLPWAELLEAVFPGARYVHITRGDTVGQAVSMWKALQTSSWRDGPAEAPRAEPRYDFEAIDRLHRRLTFEDAAWPGWFADNGIDALPVTYEQLVKSWDDTLRRVFDHIGVTPPDDLTATDSGMRRQADSTSAEWVERYRAEWPTAVS